MSDEDFGEVMEKVATHMFGTKQKRERDRFAKWCRTLNRAKVFTFLGEWFKTTDGEAITTMKLKHITGLNTRTIEEYLLNLTELGILRREEDTKPIFYYPIGNGFKERLPITKDFLLRRYPDIYNKFNNLFWKKRTKKKKVDK